MRIGALKIPNKGLLHFQRKNLLNGWSRKHVESKKEKLTQGLRPTPSQSPTIGGDELEQGYLLDVDLEGCSMEKPASDYRGKTLGNDGTVKKLDIDSDSDNDLTELLDMLAQDHREMTEEEMQPMMAAYETTHEILDLTTQDELEYSSCRSVSAVRVRSAACLRP